MDRRSLLRAGTLLLGGMAVSGRLFATPPRSPRFLLVFLRGGYDSANLLVPYSSADYYAARPTIAIARPDPAQGSSALALNADWALAPCVRDSAGVLFQQRQLSFIPFAGTEDLSRSHFETQDSIELGQPVGAVRNYRSGFLGRLAAVLGGGGRMGNSEIAFTDSLPLSFQGGPTIANQSLANLGKPPFDERQSRILSDMYAGGPLQGVIESGLELRQQVAQAMADEMAKANRDAVSIKGFELEAQRMGRLMRDDYRIGFVDVGGWDTHVNQGASNGALAGNLSGLARGLAAFGQVLGAEWSNTVVVVVSEFGRTFRENGDRGTDHGHGTVYWVLGGSINGGVVAGEQQRVAFDTLFQNRDYPVLNDYRAVLGGLFRTLWELSPAQCDKVFPEAAPRDLHLV
ncbi:MAG TPA: DUF1501 domain-containing protein [Steroidobacteraceae bacterium]|nr:DUF1501 domain-containing protein [Steroidobacteraceae bacterium]